MMVFLVMFLVMFLCDSSRASRSATTAGWAQSIAPSSTSLAQLIFATKRSGRESALKSPTATAVEPQPSVSVRSLPAGQLAAA